MGGVEKVDREEFDMTLTPYLMLVIGGFSAFAVVLFVISTWVRMSKD